VPKEKPSVRRQRRQAHRDEEFQQERERYRPTEPKTRRQAEYLRALKRNELVFATGPAGTGKSFIPASYAADLFQTGAIERLILARPAVAVENEQHGFLPGKLTQKLAPWARPIIDVLERRLTKQRVHQMCQESVIETIPFAFMRGLTFDNALVLCDEAENTTPLQMRMFLTRLGENSIVSINGDVAQKDIRQGSGLEEALALAKRHDIPHAHVDFTAEDVVRSGMARRWVFAYEAEENGQDGLLRTLRST
jgi:phosphate starvation-inducible PhoH-like protein